MALWSKIANDWNNLVNKKPAQSNQNSNNSNAKSNPATASYTSRPRPAAQTTANTNRNTQNQATRNTQTTNKAQTNKNSATSSQNVKLPTASKTTSNNTKTYSNTNYNAQHKTLADIGTSSNYTSKISTKPKNYSQTSPYSTDYTKISAGNVYKTGRNSARAVLSAKAPAMGIDKGYKIASGMDTESKNLRSTINAKVKDFYNENRSQDNSNLTDAQRQAVQYNKNVIAKSGGNFDFKDLKQVKTLKDAVASNTNTNSKIYNSTAKAAGEVTNAVTNTLIGGRGAYNGIGYAAANAVDKVAGGNNAIAGNLRKYIEEKNRDYVNNMAGNNALHTNTEWDQRFQSTGNNLANAYNALALGGGAMAADALMGLSVFGNESDQKLKEGYDIQRATNYGALKGLNEIGQEMIEPWNMASGRLPGIAEIGGEFIQEAVGQTFDPLADVALAKNKQEAKGIVAKWWNDTVSGRTLPSIISAGKEGAIGALMQGGITNPVGTVQGIVDDVRNAPRDIALEAKNAEYKLKGTNAYKEDMAELERALSTSNLSDVQKEMIRDEYLNKWASPEMLNSGAPILQTAAENANYDKIVRDAGRFGLSKEEADNIARASNKAKITVNFTDGSVFNQNTGKYVDGMELDGAIYINVAAENPVQTIFAHEIAHASQGTQEYSQYANTVRAMYDGGMLAEARPAVDAISNDENLSPEQKQNEIIAVLTQNLINNDQALTQMANKSPNTIVRLAEGMKSFFTDDVNTRKTKNALSKVEKAISNAAPMQLQGASDYYGGQKSKALPEKEFENAKKMEELGFSFKDIQQSTGFFKGFDGKWRYEGVDKRTDFKKPADMENALPDKDGAYRISDIFSDKAEILKAYPKLKNTKVYFDPMEDGALGYFDSNNKEIHINDDIDSKEVKKTIMHELQHMIQSIEGFERGTSVAEMSRSGATSVMFKDEFVNIARSLADKSGDINLKFWSDIYMHPDRWTEVLETSEENAKQNALDELLEYKDGGAAYEQLRDEYRNTLKQAAYDDYWMSKGEIEARDTQERIGMSKQRRIDNPSQGQKGAIIHSDINHEDFTSLENGESYFPEGQMYSTTGGSLYGGKAGSAFEKIRNIKKYAELTGKKYEDIRDDLKNGILSYEDNIIPITKNPDNLLNGVTSGIKAETMEEVKKEIMDKKSNAKAEKTEKAKPAPKNPKQTIETKTNTAVDGLYYFAGQQLAEYQKTHPEATSADPSYQRWAMKNWRNTKKSKRYADTSMYAVASDEAVKHAIAGGDKEEIRSRIEKGIKRGLDAITTAKAKAKTDAEVFTQTVTNAPATDSAAIDINAKIKEDKAALSKDWFAYKSTSQTPTFDEFWNTVGSKKSYKYLGMKNASDAKDNIEYAKKYFSGNHAEASAAEAAENTAKLQSVRKAITDHYSGIAPAVETVKATQEAAPVAPVAKPVEVKATKTPVIETPAVEAKKAEPVADKLEETKTVPAETATAVAPVEEKKVEPVKKAKKTKQQIFDETVTKKAPVAKKTSEEAPKITITPDEGTKKVSVTITKETKIDEPVKETKMVPTAKKIDAAQTYMDQGREFAKKQEWEKAIEFYKKASEKGNGEADYKIGLLYESTLKGDRKENLANALKYYEKGAKRGNTFAQYNLAAMYEEGNGVQKNVEKAVELYKQAAAKGDKEAKSSLARLTKGGQIKQAKTEATAEINKTTAKAVAETAKEGKPTKAAVKETKKAVKKMAKAVVEESGVKVPDEAIETAADNVAADIAKTINDHQSTQEHTMNTAIRDKEGETGLSPTAKRLVKKGINEGHFDVSSVTRFDLENSSNDRLRKFGEDKFIDMAINTDVHDLVEALKKTGQGLDTKLIVLAKREDLEQSRRILSDRVEAIKQEISNAGYKTAVKTKNGYDTLNVMDQNDHVATGEQADAFRKRIDEASEKLYYANRKYDEMGSIAGTTLSMYREFKKMPVTDQVQVIRDFAKEIDDEVGTKFKKLREKGRIPSHVTLNEGLVAEFQRSGLTEEQKQKALDNIIDDLARQYPATLRERVSKLRYGNMLSNLKTIVTNEVSNLTEHGMYSAVVPVRSAIEHILLKNHVRTDNIIMSHAEDKRLVEGSSKFVMDTLRNDSSSYVSGSKKEYFKKLGYEGKILKKLIDFAGGNGYDISMNKNIHELTANVMANRLKEMDIVYEDGEFTKNGDKVDEGSIKQIARGAYNDAVNRWVINSDLRYINQEDVDISGLDDEQKSNYRLLSKNYFDGEYIKNDKFGANSQAKNDYKNVNRNQNEMRRILGRKRQINVFSENTRIGAVNAVGKVANKAFNAYTDKIIGRLMGSSDVRYTRWTFTDLFAREMISHGYEMSLNKETNETVFTKNGEKLTKAQKDEIEQIRDRTFQTAIESTFRDFSRTADAFNQLKNSSGVAEVALGAIQPFVSTPVNVLRRSYEFSPMGLLQSVGNYTKVQNGEMSADTYIQSLSKGITGTGAVALGMLLASIGLIRGRNDDPDPEKRFKEANGYQDYAIDFGNGITADLTQLAPFSTPFLIGANVMDVARQLPKQGNESDLEHAMNVLSKGATSLIEIADPIMSTTMLSGIIDLYQNIKNEEQYGSGQVSGTDKLVDAVFRTILEKYAQQLTSSAVGAINRTINEDAKSTYDDNYYAKAARNALKNYPATYDYLENALNSRGSNSKNTGVLDFSEDKNVRTAGRALQNIVVPYKIGYADGTSYYDRKDNVSHYNDELIKLYDALGKNGKEYYYLLPKGLYSVTSVNGSGKVYSLNAKDYHDFNKDFLSMYNTYAREYIDSPLYQSASNEEKADYLKRLYNHSMNEAKSKYFKNVDFSQSDKALRNDDKNMTALEAYGIKPYQYIYNKNIEAMEDINGTAIPNSKYMIARANMQAEGIYDDVMQAYKDGKIKDLYDVGLSSTIGSWNDEEFNYYYDQLMSGTYEVKSYNSKTDDERRKETFDALDTSEKALNGAKTYLGMNADGYYDLLNTDSIKYADGTTVTNSKAYNIRQTLTESGKWDAFVKSVNEGKINYSDYGISKTVFNMSNSKFEKYYAKAKAKAGTQKGSSDTESSGSSKKYQVSSKKYQGGSKYRTKYKATKSSKKSNTKKSSSKSSKKTSAKAVTSTGLLSNEAKALFSKYVTSSKTSLKSIRSGLTDSQLQSLYNSIVGGHASNINALKSKYGLK